MNKIKQFTKSVLLAIVIYLLIRILDDTHNHSAYILREGIGQFLIEITLVIISNYVVFIVLNRLQKYFNQRIAREFKISNITQEFFYAYVATLIIVNAFYIPGVIFLTSDGLQWSDVAMINTVPILVLLIYYFISRTYYYLKQYIEHAKVIERVKSEQLSIELKFVKSQIQPHFLFNVLNTIYFQMDENVADAKKTIEKLSKLLRYRMYDMQEVYTTLAEEFDYLSDYIELQRIRYMGQLNVQFHFEKELSGSKIYPFLMLPLVENAFKYVSGEKEIRITAKCSASEFFFTVINSLDSDMDIKHKTDGIGIENLKKRLELFYPDKHNFSVIKTNNSFNAQLKIVLA